MSIVHRLSETDSLYLTLLASYSFSSDSFPCIIAPAFSTPAFSSPPQNLLLIAQLHLRSSRSDDLPLRSASEMTYIVLSGALNSTYSLTRSMASPVLNNR